MIEREMEAVSALKSSDKVESAPLNSSNIAISSNRKLDNVIASTLFFLVIGFPIFFGGVHENTWFPVSGWVLALSTIYIYKRQSEVVSMFSELKNTRFVFYAGGAFLSILLLQIIWFSIDRISHPVLGSVSSIHSWTLFNNSALSFIYSISLFILARGYFRSSPSRRKQFLKWLVASCLLVSTIALLQWFYDNGKLLWLFAPDYEFVSYRARWPFVNSNHLGAFLLLTIFPATALLYRLTKEFTVPKPSSNPTQQIQNSLFQVILVSFSILIGLFALVGSLSRGSWAGFCVGSLFLSIVFLFYSSQPKPDLYLHKDKKRSRNVERPSDLVQKILRSSSLRFIPPIFLIVAFIFFFRGKSAELFEDRIIFGLLYSMENIRLQMDSDTLGLISSHPFIGVGLGNWEPAFFNVASPLLAGLNPEYLHSDPLQFIAECGLLGVVPLGFLFWGTFKALRSASASAETGEKILSLGIAASLLAFVFGSFVEFSFRIPALLSLWCILLALLFSASEDASEAHFSNRKRRSLRRHSEDIAEIA